MRRISDKSKGFTLFELVVVLAIISAMVAVVLPFCKRSNDGLKIKQGSRNIAQALRYAIDFAQKRNIAVKFIFNEKYNRLKIPVSANIQGVIQSVPPVISYGVVNTGSRYSRIIKIKEVTGLLPSMEYVLSEISSNEIQMSIDITASNNPGLYEGTLEINIEQDGDEILYVPYTLVTKE
ncbi:MAG: pilus assembly FimT family protein [Planctomycetota bacterium]|jgi:prepilin-type N-terminal cleavage/methylation domain-containing protein